jgi:exodeoxyribonuclease VII large subunit
MSDLFDVLFEEDPEPEPEPLLATAPPPAQPMAPVTPPVATTTGMPRGVAAPAVPVATRRVMSVTALTIQIRDRLEDQFYEVWVEGELSNCRLWSSTGHLYFTLKDASSQVRGFMFRSTVRYLKFKPADGLKVIARGKISVYEPKGEYQLVCEHLEPQGLGALQLAFDQLKQRLQAEGLFDAARKRGLPALPRKIGIVTSLEGAAIRDMLKVLARRYHNAHVVIRAARVQGEGAAGEVARGLRAVARVPGVDVIIVGRGGGSIEDLWAFNEEVVARAIAASPVPVISAVGHETDVTIADFVADRRAPTPSAAAEIVVSAHEEFCARIDRLTSRAHAAARNRLQSLSRRVHVISSRPALTGVPGRVAMRGRHTSELAHAMARTLRADFGLRERRLNLLRRQLEAFDLGRRLAGIRTRLVTSDGRLGAAAHRRTDRAGARLTQTIGRLESLSPLAVLSRGYAVAWNADHTRALRDAGETQPGDRIRVTLARGELDCSIVKTSSRDKI